MSNKYALVRAIEAAMKTAAEKFINEEFDGTHSPTMDDVPLTILAKASLTAMSEHLLKAEAGVTE